MEWTITWRWPLFLVAFASVRHESTILSPETANGPLVLLQCKLTVCTVCISNAQLTQSGPGSCGRSKIFCTELVSSFFLGGGHA